MIKYYTILCKPQKVTGVLRVETIGLDGEVKNGNLSLALRSN
jgi:hypothetical protein